MSKLYEKIKNDFVDAFKSKDTIRKNILWAIKTKVVLFEKEKWDITDMDIVRIIDWKISEVNKTLEFVKKWDDLFEQTEAERLILLSYLPEQLSYDEVKGKISLFIQENKLDKKDFWKIIWKFSKELKWLFNIKELKDIINDQL